MSLAKLHQTHLDTNLGGKRERKERSGLDHSYQIKLRQLQKERVEAARISGETKAKMLESRNNFLMENIINQRWPMSLQPVYKCMFLSKSFLNPRIRQRERQRNRYRPNMAQNSSYFDIVAPSDYNDDLKREDYVEQLVRLRREEGESDEGFFERCLDHGWSIVSGLKNPDLVDRINTEKTTSTQKVIKTLANLVEVFKLLFQRKTSSLDDAILIIALSLQLLNINYFWTDLRDFMRDPQNNGLKHLIKIAGLQSKSQLIQEALIELVYDLSFSDFEGQKVNKVLYEDCLEVVEGWLGTEKWNSQQTLGCFFELLEDLFSSQVVYRKPQEQTQFSLRQDKIDADEEEKEESDSEEEEKHADHGMEEIKRPAKPSSPPQGKPITFIHPHQFQDDQKIITAEIYHRKDEKFISFLCSIYYNVLNIDYQLFSSEEPTLQQVLEKSWEKKQEPEKEYAQQQVEQELSPEIQEQLRLEDDGIEIGSETTTECSEYSEDLIENEDIERMVINLLKSLSSAFKGISSGNITRHQTRIAKSYSVNPTDYTKNERIDVKEFAESLKNWIAKKNPSRGSRLSLLDTYLKAESSGTLSSSLTSIKLAQFSKMDGKRQIAILKEMGGATGILKARFKSEDFADDLFVEILSNTNSLRDAPRALQITNFNGSGYLGDFFFSRPYPKVGSTTQEQYEQPKWLDREKNYEKAIDLIHKMVTEDPLKTGLFAKYIGQHSLLFVKFMRTILKPEIGNFLKTIDLNELKRDNFLHFRQDLG